MELIPTSLRALTHNFRCFNPRLMLFSDLLSPPHYCAGGAPCSRSTEDGVALLPSRLHLTCKPELKSAAKCVYRAVNWGG